MSLFRNRNYLLHWASTALFSLADYFTLIAMPWLALSLSGDPAVLGVVLALESLPRAAFMLVSGGFSDRYTPRLVLLFSRGAFLLTLLALALLILTGSPRVEHLYVFAFAFGLFSAFSTPAATALLPRLIEPEQMEGGNGALMGTQQLVQMIAPLMAGLLIWSVPTGAVLAPTAEVDFAEVGVTFLVSAAVVLFALILLVNLRLKPISGPQPGEGASFMEGVRYLWNDRGLRVVTFYMAFITFFAVGPMFTVIPLFAERRLEAGALSFGLLFTANGVGAMIGYTCGGLMRKPSARWLGPVMFVADLVAGLAVAAFGHTHSLATAAPALVVIGIANAVMVVLSLSWIQRRIPPALTGRVLALVMFATMGLTPISMSAAGFFIAKHSITELLTISGALISAWALLGLMIPAINRFATYDPPALVGADGPAGDPASDAV